MEQKNQYIAQLQHQAQEEQKTYTEGMATHYTQTNNITQQFD